MGIPKIDAVVGESGLFGAGVGTSGEYTYEPERKVRALAILVEATAANATADSGLTVNGTATTSQISKIQGTSAAYPWVEIRTIDLGEKQGGPFTLVVTKSKSVSLRMVVVGLRSTSAVTVAATNGSNNASSNERFVGSMTAPEGGALFLGLANQGKNLPSGRSGTLLLQRDEGETSWDIQYAEVAAGSHNEWWKWKEAFPAAVCGGLFTGTPPTTKEDEEEDKEGEAPKGNRLMLVGGVLVPVRRFIYVGGSKPLPTPTFVGDFETGDKSQYATEQSPDANGKPNESGTRITVVESPVFQGKYAGRFELKATDPETAGGPRSELVPGKNFYSGDEAWFFLAWRWPTGNLDTTKWQLFWQLHHSGSSGSPPVKLQSDYLGGKSVLWFGGYASTTYAQIERPSFDAWHYALIRVKFSKTVGEVECNVDGTQLEMSGGGTVVTGINTIGTEGEYAYLKNGIYRPNTATGTAVLFQDGYRVFDEEPDLETLLGGSSGGELVEVA